MQWLWSKLYEIERERSDLHWKGQFTQIAKNVFYHIHVCHGFEIKYPSYFPRWPCRYYSFVFIFYRIWQNTLSNTVKCIFFNVLSTTKQIPISSKVSGWRQKNSDISQLEQIETSGILYSLLQSHTHVSSTEWHFR